MSGGVDGAPVEGVEEGSQAKEDRKESEKIREFLETQGRWRQGSVDHGR
jgi:hypothetical protein